MLFIEDITDDSDKSFSENDDSSATLHSIDSERSLESNFESLSSFITYTEEETFGNKRKRQYSSPVPEGRPIKLPRSVNKTSREISTLPVVHKDWPSQYAKDYSVDRRGIIYDKYGNVQATERGNTHVRLCSTNEAKRKTALLKIDEIVMHSFVGYKKGFVVLHRDGNPANNALMNMVYTPE